MLVVRQGNWSSISEILLSVPKWLQRKARPSRSSQECFPHGDANAARPPYERQDRAGFIGQPTSHVSRNGV